MTSPNVTQLVGSKAGEKLADPETPLTELAFPPDLTSSSPVAAVTLLRNKLQ